MIISISELIAKSWEDYLENWHNWMIYSFFAFLSPFVLLVSGSFGVYLNIYFSSSVFLVNIILILLIIFSSIFGLWTYLALIHSSQKFLRNKKTGHWKEHFSATIPMLWPAFYTSFFIIISMLFGIIMFLIPAFIFAVWFYFSIFSLVDGGSEGASAMMSSKNLSASRWWSVAIRIFVSWSFFVFIGTIFQAVILSAVGMVGLQFFVSQIVSNILVSATNALITPVLVLCGLNLYNSLKENPSK